jgi:peptidoglycan DL-endopeptidase CwlO
MSGDPVADALGALTGLYGARPATAPSGVLGDGAADVQPVNDAHARALQKQSKTAQRHQQAQQTTTGVTSGLVDQVQQGRKTLTDITATYTAQLAALAPLRGTPLGAMLGLTAAQTAVGGAVGRVQNDSTAVQQSARTVAAVHEYPRRRMRVRRRRMSAEEVQASAAEVNSLAYQAGGSQAGLDVVHAAAQWIGEPYVWGGGGLSGPTGGGFDCSGLTRYAVAQATDGRVILPRTTYEQYHAGVRIPASEVQPGDLVFPADEFDSRGPEHVQLAIGDGKVIEAPHSGADVRVVDMPRDAVVIRVV